jgi:hypothetical protein
LDVQHELADAELENIDVEGLLGFAKDVLTDAARLWLEAPAEQKRSLQQVRFPEGLRLKDGRFGTAVTCVAFKQLAEHSTRELELASPSGTDTEWIAEFEGFSPTKFKAA